MFKNFLIVAWRKMTRQRIYALINISGLAIGLAAAMFILIWVRDERSYDRHHENAGRIYRVTQSFHYGDYYLEQTQTPPILAATMKDECPDVEEVTRVRGFRGEMLVKAGEKALNERGLGIADESFFRVFSFPLIAGDPATVLREPHTVALSETAAKKYFGAPEAVGRVLTASGQDYRVTGVFKDMPAQSHFHLDVLCSLASFKEYQEPAWGLNAFKTYARLGTGASREAVEGQLAGIVRDHMFDSREEYAAVTAKGEYTRLTLQPLTDIHLKSRLLWEFEANGNGTYVGFFSIIAVFILLIAGVNYINLSTARSAGRAREVGIRKTVGSGRSSLIRLFLMESVLTSLLALLLSLGVLHALWRPFCDLVGKPWLKIPYLEDPLRLIPLVALAAAIGAAAGIYPSLFLSSFKPLSALSGRSGRGRRRSGPRNALVLAQFSISLLLLVGTLVVHQQMKYIQARSLGYSPEQVVVVKTYGELASKLPVLKDALRLRPSVVSVSASSSAPGTGFNNIGMGLEGANSSVGRNLYAADEDFLDVMKMELAEGRFFAPGNPADGQAVVINQGLARALGGGDLLGQRMRIWNGSNGYVLSPIIGIVKDFHYESFHEPIKPLAIVRLGGAFLFGESYVSIRVRTADMPKTLSEIRQTWESAAPGAPFTYSFLDSLAEAQYQNEARTGRVFTIFTLLALFVAFLGLLGLASFAVEQRTREIGIRKILGASVPRLVWDLSGEFAGWVTGANLVACPLAFVLMTRWLRSFAYRTDLGPRPFLVAALLILGISGLTVGYHALRSAAAKPVEALRHE